MEAEPQHRDSFSAGRRWAILLRVAVACLALLAIVVMANYLGVRHFGRFMLGGKGQGSLSPQTLTLLRSLTNQIDITVFFEKDESDARSLLNGLLKEYAAASRRISIKHIAPDSEPARTSLALAHYKLETQTLPKGNFIVVACDLTTHVITEGELADRDYNDMLRSRAAEDQREREVPLKNFKGEMAISGAIFTVTNPRILHAYFLNGHGERGPADDSPKGYSKFSELLKQQLNIECETLSLLRLKEVPADCQLLVIAGPLRAYEPHELEMIEAYLKQGGRALVLFSSLPDTISRSGLETVLEKWRIAVLDDMVSDPPFTRGGELYVAALNDKHPITQPLVSADAPIQLSLPRSVEGLAAARNAGGVTVNPLASTSTNGFTSTQISRAGVPIPNDFHEPRTVYLMAAAEQGIPGVDNTRLVVVGDSACMNNAHMGSFANASFTRQAVGWLVDRPQDLLKDLGPRPLDKHTLAMDDHQQRMVRWLLLAAVPGGVLLLGSLVWLRRRS